MRCQMSLAYPADEEDIPNQEVTVKMMNAIIRKIR
jgi:hypothetical protein